MNAFWRNTLLVFRMIQPNQRQFKDISLVGVNQRQMRFLAFVGFSTPQHAIRACCVDLDECLHAHSALIWQHAIRACCVDLDECLNAYSALIWIYSPKAGAFPKRAYQGGGPLN